MRRFLSRSFIVASLLLTSVSLLAQEAGSIRGQILDRDFEAPLAAAKVTVAETGAEVTATDDGNFVFGSLEPGVYTLIFSKEGYTREVTANVVVSAGRLTETNASLSGEFTEMEEFVVQDIQFGGASEIGLLELRFDSAALIDSVGAELISKAGAGDAASALTLVSGATVQDGKFAVIRGLPDRYVNSQLNGLRLPTADAEKRAVALDQFPSAAIESIQVSKTFTPDQQGDASGGAVNVVLKGVPDENGFTASASTSYNTRTSGRDDFLTYEGGGVSTFGFDDGRRDVERQPEGGNWDGAVGAKEGKAPVDYKWGMSGAQKYELGNEVKVGGFGSIFYERDSQSIQNGVDDRYWVTKPGAQPTPETSQGSPQEGTFLTNLFDITQSEQQVKWGALGVLGLETENHSLTFTALYTRDAEDTVTLAEDTRGKEYYFPGYNVDDPNDPGNQNQQAAPYLRLETLKYTERETQTFQLAGKHKAPDPEIGVDGFFEILGPELDWSVAKSSALLNEPDKRQFGSQWYAASFNPGFPPFVPPSTSEPQHIPFKPAANFTIGNLQRISKEITEDSEQYAVNLKLPFQQWTDTEGYFKVGVFNDEVTRRYEQQSFSNFNDNDARYFGEFDDFWSQNFPDEDHPITAADIDVNYDGEQQISAWYWMADVPLTNWFNVIGGIRYESTNISIVNQAERDATWFPPGALTLVQLNPGDADVAFEQEDELPSIGFKFTPIEQITLRGTYSETVARQTFRELSPILQQEFLGGDIFIGNPALQMSALRNYDLRLDYTPYAGSLVSGSYFIKEITDPIENVQRIGNGFTYITPVNYPEGEINGFELEVRQDIGRFFDIAEGLSLGANYTLINSEVTLPEEEAAQFRDPNINAPITTRDATNAPEYLYNLYSIYNLKKLGLPDTEATVFYTVRGDTLIAGPGTSVGNFVPAIYEKEYGTLNAGVSHKIAPGWTIKAQAKNILDPEIETVYRSEFIDGDVTRTSYQKGIEYSFGLSASF